MTKLKLCYLASPESIHTQRWLKHFVDKEYEVHLITLHKPVEVEGVFMHHIPSILSRYKDVAFLINYWKIRKIIKEIKPDVLNGFFLVNYGFYAATMGYHPLVVGAWGSDVLIHPQRSKKFRWMVKFTQEKADLITSDAPVITRTMIQNYSTPSSKIVTSPFGIEDELFHSKEKVFNKSPKTILSLRWLEPNYNVSLIVKAFRIVLDKFPDVALIIGADGSQRKDLELLAKNTRLYPKIRFIGTLSRPDMAKYLKLADIFVSVPFSDGTSATLLEAMACGAFPIVSDISSNREWVEDNKNGFVVPLDSADVLAQQLVQALKDDDLRKKASEINWAMIQKKALWRNNMEQIENAYIKLVDEFRDKNISYGHKKTKH